MYINKYTKLMNTDEVGLFLVDIKSYICLKDDNI